MRRRTFHHLLRAGGLAVIVLTLIAGCGKKQAAGRGGQAGAVEVGVLMIATAPVTLTEDLPGRTSAFRVAEVRARVSSIVLKRFFTEGSDVTEGQVLYEIDAAPYQAALESAPGTLGRAEAKVATARAKERRSKQLVKASAISQQDSDDAVANQGSFELDVLSGHAAQNGSAHSSRLWRGRREGIGGIIEAPRYSRGKRPTF